MFLQMDEREFATVLAALRYWQANNRQNAKRAPEYDIASDSGKLQPLGDLEIDELCERINCEPTLPDQLVSAMERVSAACGGGDYDWAGEVEAVLEAAYQAGMGPKVSAELKRLLMAEIDNEAEGGDSPATLETVKASLDSGYKPCDKFSVGKVKKELTGLIDRIGGTVPAKRLLTTADWESRAMC